MVWVSIFAKIQAFLRIIVAKVNGIVISWISHNEIRKIARMSILLHCVCDFFLY